jgi:hypothetical protein
MAKLAAWVAFVFIVMGCGVKMVWWKQDITKDEFNRDKYACIEESQQRVSDEYINLYGGVSRSSITNPELFNACMESRGYSFMREDELPK